MTFRVRALTAGDVAWTAPLVQERWGGAVVVSRGHLHDIDRLPGLVAEDNGRPVGLLTYRIDAGECEVVTLDAVARGRGVGTALLDAAAELARSGGCRRLWLITTNDNLDALRFYQRRGLTLVAVYPGAVDASRRLKPAISQIGDFGIPIRDEIELERRFDRAG